MELAILFGLWGIAMALLVGLVHIGNEIGTMTWNVKLPTIEVRHHRPDDIQEKP